MSRIFEGPHVETVYSTFGLSLSNYITCGSAAEIYEGERGVLRLSSDASSHCIVVEGNLRGWAVPNVYKDYGAVAQSDDYDGYEDRYWLAEIERLRPVSQYPKLELQLINWLEKLLEPFNGSQLIEFVDVDTLRAKLLGLPVEPALERVRQSLIDIMALCNGDMDLNVTNFMIRQNTGEVLLVDPAHGWYINPGVWVCGGGSLAECLSAG